MRNSLRTAVTGTAALLFFAQLGQAQTLASYTPSFAVGQVNSNNVYPFSTNPGRYQQIHDAWTFTAQTPTLVRGMRYRPSNQSTYVNKAGATVEVAIELGLAATGITAATGGNALDSNFDASTRKLVFSRKTINYPSSGATVEELQIFDISFPFDAGALLLLTPTNGRSLVIETRQYSRTGGYAFDFVSSASVAGNGFAVQNGAFDGCPSKGNVVPQFVGNTPVLKVGGTFDFTGTYDQAGIPALLTLGAQRTSVALPGTNCFLMNDLVWLQPGLTSNTNEFNVSFPVANSSSFADLRFWTQMFFLEAGANPLGIVASRGLECGIGRGASQTTLGIARIYAFNANPDSITTATSNIKNGLVVMLHN